MLHIVKQQKSILVNLQILDNHEKDESKFKASAKGAGR
jgi:hypothetical protein